jgi:hypothetical protein
VKRTPLARGKALERKPMARKPVRLNQRSAKMADAYARPGGRRDLVAALLAESPRCQIRVLCRGARAVDVHERLKRSRGGDILDPVQAHMVTACRACHDWTEREPQAATAARMLLPSWHKCPPVGPC